MVCLGNICRSPLAEGILRNKIPNMNVAVDSAKRPASGVFAVKVVNTLVKNLKKDIEGGSLKKWFPQKIGLQIVNIFPSHHQKAFAIYRNFVFGPSFIFWILKHKIDLNFIKKFRSKRLIMKSSEKIFH